MPSFAYKIGYAAFEITSQSGRVSGLQLAALAARPDTLRSVLAHRAAVDWVPVPPTPVDWLPSLSATADFWLGFARASQAARSAVRAAF